MINQLIGLQHLRQELACDLKTNSEEFLEVSTSMAQAILTADASVLEEFQYDFDLEVTRIVDARDHEGVDVGPIVTMELTLLNAMLGKVNSTYLTSLLAQASNLL